MKCIRQYFRKRALIKEHTLTTEKLMNDIYLNQQMRRDNWDVEFASGMRNHMIFMRSWESRFVRRLKAL